MDTLQALATPAYPGAWLENTNDMCDICGTVFLLFLMSTPGRFSGVSEVLYIIMNEEGELGLWLRMFGITKRNE